MPPEILVIFKVDEMLLDMVWNAKHIFSPSERQPVWILFCALVHAR